MSDYGSGLTAIPSVGPKMAGLYTPVITLTSGTEKIVNMRGASLPATVWTSPGAGDTVTVSYSLDGGATYAAWVLGAITSASTDKALVFYGGVTHIKFQRTAGTGTTSTCGIC